MRLRATTVFSGQNVDSFNATLNYSIEHFAVRSRFDSIAPGVQIELDACAQFRRGGGIGLLQFHVHLARGSWTSFGIERIWRCAAVVLQFQDRCKNIVLASLLGPD